MLPRLVLQLLLLCAPLLCKVCTKYASNVRHHDLYNIIRITLHSMYNTSACPLNCRHKAQLLEVSNIRDYLQRITSFNLSCMPVWIPFCSIACKYDLNTVPSYPSIHASLLSLPLPPFSLISSRNHLQVPSSHGTSGSS